MATSVSSAAADSSDATFCCAVAAYGVVEAAPADLPALREQPGGPSGRQLPPRFLRHADEQTVVGLAAVLRAIDQHHLEPQGFDDWGVIAAPQFPGRIAGAAALAKFQQEGHVTVSPHIIPQHSLHSLSSAISIALAVHGPTFGVGGGPEAVAEAFTVAVSFLEHGCWPGLWLVLTGWTPEPLPGDMGSGTLDAVCRGVALALVPGDGPGWSLRLTSPQATCPADEAIATADFVPAAAAVAELAGRLTAKSRQSSATRWSYSLPWGGQVELMLAAERPGKAA